jgi:LAGLIDADG endonuclease
MVSRFYSRRWYGSFQIKLTPRKSKTPLRVHVVIQIDAKSDDILNKIKKTYGGSVSYRANQNTYSYTSGSFKNAYMFRNYLDKFQVSHNNFKLYIIWREALEVVNAKQHRSALGLEKLELLKQHLSRSKKNVLKLVELTA